MEFSKTEGVEGKWQTSHLKQCLILSCSQKESFGKQKGFHIQYVSYSRESAPPGSQNEQPQRLIFWKKKKELLLTVGKQDLENEVNFSWG